RTRRMIPPFVEISPTFTQCCHGRGVLLNSLQANTARSTRRGRHRPRHASGPMLQEVSMRESPAIPQAMQQHGGIAKRAATCGRDRLVDKQDIDKEDIGKEDLAKATPNPDEARSLINRAQQVRDLNSSN